MKKFLIVLQYEFKEYLNSKSFVSITVILAVVSAVLLFAPRFFDFGGDDAGANEKNTVLIYDEEGLLELDEINAVSETTEYKAAKSVDEIKKKVEKKEIEIGYNLKSYTEYDYYLYNTSLYGSGNEEFEAVLTQYQLADYSEKNGLNYEDMVSLHNPVFTVSQEILGKDSASNHWYSYALVIVVFMLIMIYGQMIATAVTVEKSNRAIEVLVTTTTPNSLLFGKVIAGAFAGLLQVSVVLGTALVSYQINRDLWNNSLDMFLHIPAEVLVVFALFGIGGYLFYAFLYGAVGALVSKTEDLSKVSGGLNMILMLIYFVVLFLVQLGDIDSILMKVLSILPFSSYTAMFVRMAMGNVAIWEMVVSFLVLAISVYAAGRLGAKIYRMGTLRYGNPIKITTALKDIRNKN